MSEPEPAAVPATGPDGPGEDASPSDTFEGETLAEIGAGEPDLPLAYHQRILIVGTTRSGKSVLAESLASSLTVRLLVIDPKGQCGAYGPRMTTAEVRAWFGRPNPSSADEAGRWSRVARWVPTRNEPDEYDEIYELAHRFRGPLVVVTDELYGPGNAQKAPRHLRLYLTQGGGLRHGHIGLTQRPANICMEARTEWDHLVVYSPPPDPDDLRAVAKSTGIDLDTLTVELRALPRWGFVWVDRSNPREIIASGPVALETGRIV